MAVLSPFTVQYARTGTEDWREFSGGPYTRWEAAVNAASTLVSVGFNARVIYVATGEIVAAMVPPLVGPGGVAARVAIVVD